jgi:hypothetical protein
MDLIGPVQKFRIGDLATWDGSGGSCGTVVSVVSWRDCILTMDDTDAIMFTDQIRARCVGKVDDYQRVAIKVGDALFWKNNFEVAHVKREVGIVEGEGQDGI